MKLFATLAAGLLAMVAHSASAADPAFGSHRESAVMMYFSKSFGSDQPRNRSPLAFGLRLQQQGSFDQVRPVALLDARYSLGGQTQLLFAGLNAFGSTDASAESSSASNDMSARHPGWTVTMIVAAVLAGMCLAEWCKSDNDDDDGPEYVVPGGG